MLVDVSPAIIQHFLEAGGMPHELSQACEIQPVSEGGLAITFKIESPSGIFYLKFHEAEGARGGPFLKHLLPINDPEMRVHAEKRRRFVRKMLNSVVAYRSTLIPQPSYFDLQPHPMAIQKLKGQVKAELRVEGEIYPPRLSGMVGTLWRGANLQHIPTLSPEKRNVWSPLDYSLANVSLCTATIGELQTQAAIFVESKIQSKVAAGKGSREEVQSKIHSKLQHEQRALIGYERLVDEFFSSLKLDVASPDRAGHLQAFGEQILHQIQGRPSIAESQHQFLASVAIPPGYEEHTFQQLLFIAERERWWTPEERRKGKAIDQLHQAATIAQELAKDPTRVLSLIEELLKFKGVYEELQQLPQAIVPQDAHPFNFFFNEEDRRITMLDLEDLSMGVRFADLSTVYAFKILYGLELGKITKDQANAYLKAAIDGYNSQVASPLSPQELKLMVDYAIGVFLNFLPQFGIILRMNPNELDAYNLAMSLDAFMQQLQLLQRLAVLWAEARASLVLERVVN
jgi:hypothetical protein